MNKCIIFLSKKEEYLGSAKKIQDNINIKTDIIYIEDFMKVKNKVNLLENSIIYFLCNSNLIKKLVTILSKTNCYIFNKGFFENNYSKLKIQKILIENKLNVPKIFYNDRDIKYPVFCKENKHGGIIFKAYTSKTIKEFFKRFNKRNFYIEENIDAQQEEKYYFIKISKVIESYCDKISEILNLEIFSLDIINNNNSYIIIDVNSSAGFYLSDDARNSLIKEIEKMKG